VDKSPDAFRTISEAADELDLPQHVLRFWETRFSTIKPLKRGGGRRYYRPEDVLLLKGIRHLLYEQGFTIKGVQKILKDQGARHVVALVNGGSMDALPSPADYDESEDPQVDIADEEAASETTPRSGVAVDGTARERLNGVLKELLECKRLLERARE
jgi:DNA-binding transcriptional MerR regulator